MNPLSRRAALGAIAAASIPAQNLAEEDFQPYGAHPRLFLNARRLRLLKRERERTSVRWNQFETLVAGKAQMPETGFAHALYYAVGGNAEFGKSAIQFALKSNDIRQAAIV
ncbi:MAG: hypothetical protein FJW32_08885, partial [Acidobacteria bacterium]|nr:hypothetical protein [Acidobacteriota bacterium]